MKIAHAPLRRILSPAAWCGVVMLLFLLSISTAAQSTDIEYPTPVRTNEINGTITPRDVGDARLTRYFYSLTGTSGDLIVTVESRNLNGDVDLFTAGGLRPLVKLSMYAGDAASRSARTVYFKRDEPLILRVEARSPNDNEGSFRIRFDGAFAPFVGEAREPEPIGPATPPAGTTNGKTRRVTATGARIDEPVVETAAKTPESATPSTPAPDTSATEKAPETNEPTATETEPAPRTKARPPRPRRPRTPRASQRTARKSPSPSTTEGPPPVQAEQPAASAPPPATPEPAAAGPRLIIETRDGLRVERYMTTVRRVTVDNGQVVVVLKNGRVERQPMTNVLKMSIEP